MANEKFDNAKKGKNDEFYTQYADIQKEVNSYLEYDPNIFCNKTVLLPCDDPEWSNFTRFFAQNFEKLGLKKLISTSFATDSKKFKSNVQLSFLEIQSPKFDKKKTNTHGKIFTLTRDTNKSGNIDIDDLEWEYLKGDGDFRSEEVKKLRDESDIIITNPPFSLFREFVDWIIQSGKKFLIIGNQNAISYKEIFPLLRDNKMWTGCRFNQRVNGKNMTFVVPDDYPLSGTEVSFDEKGRKLISVAGTGWFTNLEHGRRHQPLQLMTMADNLKYSKHKEIVSMGYPKYVNYDAIDVSFTDAIPDDYDGEMGVPLSFLNKYNPDQFEILALGIVGSITFSSARKMEILDKHGNSTGKYTINAKGTLYKKWDKNADTKAPAFKDCEDGTLYQSIYARIIIRRKK
jgi:hypothetical protein